MPPPPSYAPPPSYPPASETGTSTIYSPSSTSYTLHPSYTATATQPAHFVSEATKGRWSRARIIYGMGGVVGLVGTGLTISSMLVVAITGYPCNPNDPIHQINPNDTCNAKGAMYDPPSPTDAAPLLAYLGSSVSATGFIFSAAGLGYQHSILRDLGGDVDRGVFHGGTALGVLGFAAVGISYFFGFTDYLSPHDQGIAILASTVTGAGLCALGSLLYTIDGSRTKKAWLKLSTF